MDKILNNSILLIKIISALTIFSFFSSSNSNFLLMKKATDILWEDIEQEDESFSEEDNHEDDTNEYDIIYSVTDSFSKKEYLKVKLKLLKISANRGSTFKGWQTPLTI